MACGDGGDDTSPTTGTTPSATGTSSGAVRAANLIPDLQEDGFTLQDSGRPEGAASSQDVHFAIFSGTGSVAAVRLEINVQPTAEAAAAQFSALADALRNPPPDLFGPNATQADGTAVYQADQSRSYVTTRPDAQGNLVYTDAHRFGPAVVILYVISNNEEDAATLREQLADWISRQSS